jgi:hypothetical protein
MEETYTIQRLLALRKLTRAIAELLRAQMGEYFTALAPLFRPRTVLGEYVQGSAKESAKGADAAFKELQSLYNTIAPAKPFSLAKELRLPLEVSGAMPEVTPVEYSHPATTAGQSKIVTITSPLKWVLSYPGYPLARLRELRDDPYRSADEMQRAILHYLTLHIVVCKQPGLAKLLAALHFSLSAGQLPEFGELPITYLTADISTIRPPDEVIIENTEITGLDAFEEIVNLEDIARLRDPFAERLAELVKSHGIELPLQ